MTEINDNQIISLAHHLFSNNRETGIAIFQLLTQLGCKWDDKATANTIKSILRRHNWTHDSKQIKVEGKLVRTWFPAKTDDKDQEIISLKLEIVRLRKELETANQKLEWKNGVDETISFVKECQEESEIYPDCSQMLQDKPNQIKPSQQPLNSNGLTGVDLRELAKMMDLD